MTDSELCFLTRDDVNSLRREYPELDARLQRFAQVGKGHDDAPIATPVIRPLKIESRYR